MQRGEVGARGPERLKCSGRVLAGTFILAAMQGCLGASDGENAQDALQAPERTLVEVFRLGGNEPAEAEMFESFPRLVVDEAGLLYVVHRRQGRVSVFDQDGEFVNWIGAGSGRGPGEFNSPSGLGLLGDTIWIRNLNPPHITLFDPDGTLLRTDPVLLGASLGMISATQGLSGYLSGGLAWVEPDGPPSALDEGMFPTSALQMGSRQVEASRDTVLTWRSNRGRLRGLHFDPIPEPPFFAVAADGSGVVVAEWSDDHPERLVLRVLNPDGSSRWSEELVVPRKVVPGKEREAIVRDGRDRVSELRESLLEMGLSSSGAPEVPTEAEARGLMFLPTHRPPIRAVSLGVDGTIWLNLAEPGSTGSWLAIDPNQGTLFRVELPEGARFGQATRNAVWYSEADDLGVTWVVRAEVVDSAERPE